MLDILLRQGFTVEEENHFNTKLHAKDIWHQAENDRLDAGAYFSQEWKRRLTDGSYQTEVSDELESDADYERAFRQRESFVENLLSVRAEIGLENTQAIRDKTEREFWKTEHPLARPLTDYLDRRESVHLKRRHAIATILQKAGEMCCITVPLRLANEELANVAAVADESFVNKNNIFYSHFCVT